MSNKDKSIPEKILDSISNIYQYSNSVELHWMKNEYEEKQKQKHNDKLYNNKDQRLQENNETSERSVRSNDSDIQFDPKVGNRLRTTQNNSGRINIKGQDERNIISEKKKLSSGN